MKKQRMLTWILGIGLAGSLLNCSNNTEKLYHQAQAEAELGSPVRAVDLLNRVERENPAFTDAYLLAGKLFRENNNFDSAIDQYKRGLMAGADTARIALEIGRVYLDQKNYSEAYKYFNQSLTRQPKNVAGNIGLAKVLYQQKLYGKAQKHYQRALKEDPNNYTALVGVAYSYMQQKNVAGALEMFQKAIAANPITGDAYVGKALALSKTEKTPLEQIQKAFEQARQMDPKNRAAAKTFVEFIDKPAFDLDYRITQTKTYIADFPTDNDVLKILGDLYIQKSRTGDAIWLDAAEQTFKRVLGSAPEDHASHARLAVIYLLAGKPQLAVLRAKMAFEIEPTADYAALVRQAETAARKD